MNNRFAIGIPTLNRADLLIPSLKSYFKDMPTTKIFVVDNGRQPELEKLEHQNLYVTVMMTGNVGVAASWNILCDQIFKEHDFAVILNDDIMLGRTEEQLDDIITFARRPFIANPMDFCSFIISRPLFDMVGRFDEQFYPAYLEDNDYVYRMKLMKLDLYKQAQLLPAVHRVSQTLKKDDTIRSAYLKNKKKYEAKWGGPVGREIFKTPYNK